MKKATFNVKGMHCKSCEMIIGESLTDLGAKKAKAAWKAGTVDVEYDEKTLSEQQIKDAIKKEGYEVVK